MLVGRGYVSIRPEFEGDWSRSVTSRASNAGKAGAGAFSKAFGAGLKGIGALAGVAVGANLASAAAGAALLAPALTTAGAAAGALKLGLSGVGEAFKAAFADSSADAKAAASATKAVESAQRGLADAQRNLARARVDAAKRVADAQRQVRDAERDLSDAQQDARQVQGELNDARREAARALEDMNQRLAESHLDEREAILRLKDAEKELRDAQRKPGVTPQELEELQIRYERAQLNLQEQRRETKRLADDTKKANKAGVDGSQQVLAVKERISEANQNVADKERALADAQRGVNEARAEGAQQVADAQRAVAEAMSAVADAQAAAAAQTSKLDEAMAKLTPNAKSFVRAVQGLAPAWDSMRRSVQNELFSGLDQSITTLGRTAIPVLQRQLTATAGVWNTIAKNASGAITEMAKSGMLDKILAGATENLRAFEKAPGQLITAWGQLSVAAQPAFNALMQQMAGAITSFSDGIAKSFESGGLEEGISTAFEILSQFGTLLGNVLGVVQQIFKAASDAGGQIVGALGQVFGELEKILAAPEMQATLRNLFASVAQIVGAIVPVIGAVVQAAVPLMAAIAAPIAQLATVLGPVLQQLATTLGAVLMPLVQALMPVLVQVGAAIVQVVQAVMPLLQPIALLIASIVNALAPALQPVIALVTGLVAALVGPLTSVVQALAPILTQVAELITEVFLQLMTAIEPLIPIALQLVQEVFAALQPMLPAVATAFGAIAQAAIALLPPIAQIASQLGQALIPIVASLAPLVAQLGELFAGLLLQAMPPLTAAVLTLFTALEPLWPLIGQLIGQVVSLATGLLSQLMPSFVQLTLALVPIIPSLAKIVALVLELAVKVLSWLLPPLLELAGFLTGLLARALQTAIGWLTSLVKVIASLVGWVADRLGPAMIWLRDKVILPAWRAIRIGISTSWNFIRDKIFNPIRTFFTVLIPSWARTLSLRVVGQYLAMRNGISAVWGWIKKHILSPIRTFFTQTVPGWATTLKDRLVGAFDAARKGIAKTWDKIKNATKTPIKWVIDIVYNQGVRGLWNAAAKVLPIDKLPAFKPKGWARGGVLPGYQSAKRDDVLTPMRSGEGVLVPEVVRGIGPGTIHALNDAGNRGGAGAVRRLLGYAEGGIVGHHGGIDDWFGGTLDKLGNLVSKGKDWILGGVYKAAQLAAKPIRDLIARIPGGTKGFGALAKALPTSLLNKALAFIKGSEDSQMGGGQWVKPVDAPYGTKFGVPGRMWSSGRHTGLDFPAAVGKAVHAVANGQITSARSGGPYGNHILINHGHGLQSLYAHLSAMVKKAGAVQAGQTIGRVGATGNVTGPHLHLEARVNGKPVDPMPYLTGGGQGSGGKGVQRWRGVVNQALDLVGQPRAHANTTLRRMNQESGGDPNIVNRWDSNWKAGHPSVGLMQVIGPTFRAYAGRFRNKGPFSYGVSTNPLANVYASMRYALSRYGSLPRAYNRPGGYDEGGWLGPGQIGVNHLRQPEAVLTPSQWRTMSSLAAAGGAARFEGDLYLDSGEFLGRVRGEAQQVVMERDRLVMAAGRGGRRP
ncbi:peptidoglycan DD-metalloendopeptidase family protein [Streptomyces sp. NPDC006240]|uniref:peptidoglycan DD-metalloendopeptidase family protein n=1 Tax=Streptomyces sp. NPDC006240 TaxID=3156737 RepID=UPI0033A65D51